MDVCTGLDQQRHTCLLCISNCKVKGSVATFVCKVHVCACLYELDDVWYISSGCDGQMWVWVIKCW